MTRLSSTDEASGYAVSILTGDHIRLRALNETEIPLLESWWADPAIAIQQQSIVRPRPPGGMADTLRAWSTNADSTGVGFAVSPRDGSALIGHVALYGATPVTRSATVGIVMSPEATGKGLGTDALRTLVRYGFDEFGLNRIELQVWAFNTRAVRAYEKAGFTEEGRKREAIFHSGVFHDEVLMSVLAREWRARRD